MPQLVNVRATPAEYVAGPAVDVKNRRPSVDGKKPSFAAVATGFPVIKTAVADGHDARLSLEDVLVVTPTPLGGSASAELRFLPANLVDLDIKRSDEKLFERRLSRKDVLKRYAAEQAEGFVKRSDLAHLLERRAFREGVRELGPRSQLAIRWSPPSRPPPIPRWGRGNVV